MTEVELNELMNDEDICFAYVYKKEDQGSHSDYLFKMTAENIGNFIGKYAYNADRIILTDIFDELICEAIYGGFLIKCPNQKLCREIIPYLAPIQRGEVEPLEISVATREEMEALWDEEEVLNMEAEIKML